MKKYFLIGLSLFVTCIVTAQQIHNGTKRLFWADNTSPVINVYDINKETLLKSINRGETAGVGSYIMSFNTAQTTLYALGKQFATVIDVNTLEAKKIQLLSDNENAVQDFVKLMQLNDAESERVKKEINAGNLEAKLTETPEIKQMKALPYTIIGLGVTEKGVAFMSRTFADRTEYTSFDLANEGKKINTISLEKGSNRTFHDGTILQPEQDGSITVIDALTGNTLRKIEGAFDAAAISEAQSKATTSYDKKISTTVSSYGEYLCTQVNLGTVPNTAQMSFAYALYDLNASNIIYKERTTRFIPEVIPVQGESPHHFFQKAISKTPEPQIQMPPAPDYAKMKPADMAASIQEYPKQIQAAQGEWKIKHDEWSKPVNFTTKLFSDAACTQEVLSVDAARYAWITGEFLIFIKESAIELYDIKNRKLVHTIYLI